MLFLLQFFNGGNCPQGHRGFLERELRQYLDWAASIACLQRTGNLVEIISAALNRQPPPVVA